MSNFYTSCESKADLELLRTYVIRGNYWIYGPLRKNIHPRFPFYYNITTNTSGWQDAEKDKTWYSPQSEECYNNAIPVIALSQPDKYPEYFI